jgi:L-amino acid N-acyltransferase YncA
MTAPGARREAVALRPPTGASAVRIRAARGVDLPAVQAIYAAHVLAGTGTFEEVPPGLGEIEARWRRIVERDLPYLVAGDGERVHGFAYAGPFRPRSAYRFTVEDSIYVAPDALGGGLGSALLASLIAACEELGMRQMIAVIGDSANTRSIRLHRRHSFVRAGTLVDAGYKFGRWLDAVFMQRTLGGSGPGAERR